MTSMRCGVAGSPIVHSLSPVLHQAAYDALGLDWSYAAHDVDEAALPGFLTALGPQWRGLSLTMPLKRAVLAHCAEITETVRQVGAANTLVIDADGRRVGHNTDVPGLVAAWREAALIPPDDGLRAGRALGEVVLLGAGATARSAVAALAVIGAMRVTVLARSPERAAALLPLLHDLGLQGGVASLAHANRSAEHVDLVVSTVPEPAQRDLLDLPAVQDLLARAAALFDVAYGVRSPALVGAARAAGVPCADGFGLLLHQAGRQVELMTGCAEAPLEVMRSAGEAARLTRAAAEE